MSAIKLPSLFSAGMVIQAQKPRTIHGSIADTGSSDKKPVLSVAFLGKTYTTMPDEAGARRVTLAPMPSGGPYTLQVGCAGEAFAIDGVYVGEVFLCAVQQGTPDGTAERRVS